MSNEWFIIANRFSNSGKTISVINKTVKKLEEEKKLSDEKAEKEKVATRY